MKTHLLVALLALSGCSALRAAPPTATHHDSLVQTLRQDLAEQQARADTLELEVSDRQRRIDELRADLAVQQNAMASSGDQHLRDIASLRAERSRLRSQIRESRQALKQSETALADLRTSAAARDAEALRQIEVVRAELSGANVRVGRLQAKVLRLREDRDALAASRIAIEEDLRRTQARLAGSKDDARLLRAERDRLKAKLQSSGTTANELASTKAELARIHQQLADARSAVPELKAEIGTLKAELSATQTKLASATVLATERGETNRRLRRKISHLTAAAGQPPGPKGPRKVAQTEDAR